MHAHTHRYTHTQPYSCCTFSFSFFLTIHVDTGTLLLLLSQHLCSCKCQHVVHALISLHTFKIPCPSLDMRRSNGRWCGHTHMHARNHARTPPPPPHTHTHNLMEEEDGGQVWESDWLPIVDFLVLCFRFETVISQGLFFVVCFIIFVCFVFVLFFIEARNASSNQVQITVLNAFNILHTETCVTRWWAFCF